MVAPAIDSVSPSTGPISGGTIVTLSGSDFTPDTTVSFNRNAATNTQVVDSSHVRLTVPPLGTGPFATALAAVRVGNVHGTTYAEYFYASPTFDQIGIGDITTIAGVGNFVGEGRLATQALVEAEAIAVDAGGNIYLGEETGGLVRKIGSDGRIVTVAGTGIIGYSGDGGPATDAQFNWPAGVAVDRGGNVFVTDFFGNSRVRRIDASTGIVTTIGGNGVRGYGGDGGPATQAAFNRPIALALGAQGEVYVVDSGNDRIRKISASGIITTVAGNGAVGFSGDGGPASQAAFAVTDEALSTLTIDSRGTLYVVDHGNSRIRRIGTDGIVTTVVGGGTQPLAAAGAVATRVTDIFNCVTVDGQDRLIFSTPTSVWRLESDGTLTRLGGTSTMGFSPDGAIAAGSHMSPQNLAMAPNGDILVSERDARRIRRISASTGALSTLAGIGPAWIGDDGTPAVQAVFGDVGNLALDADGNILVVDGRGSLRIRKINASGAMTTVAGAGIAAVQGSYHEGIAAASAGMAPVSVGADAANTIYFTDFCSVRHIASDGSVHTVVGPLTSAQQCGFGGDGETGSMALVGAEQNVLKVDPQGGVFFADVFNQRVRRYDPVSAIVTTYAGSGPASDGGYFTGTAGFAGDGAPASQALLSNPTDVAFDAHGNVCISDTGNSAVRCVDAQGIIRTVAGRGASYPGDGEPATSVAIDPYRIAFDRAGNMYIAMYNDGTIRKLDTNGILTTIAGRHGSRGFSGDGGPATQAQMDYGSGLAVDPQGNVLVYDGGNRRVRVIKEAATLGNAPAANLPGVLSGLWWNPSESGWGIDLTQRGNTLFAAWYTYDAAGNPKWYVASNCAMASPTACSGTVYQVTGPRFFGVPFNPAADVVVPAGSMTLTFASNDSGSFTYSVGGMSRTVAIERELFANGPAPGPSFTDLWWNPSESGWGLAVTEQGSIMFLAWFVYDDTGSPVWYVASSCGVNAAGNGCTGTLYRTTGPAPGPSFDATAVHATAVGAVTLSFSDANNGTLSFTVGTASGSKAITRQVF